MLAAGLIHLAIAPLHWGHAPAHGIFFILSGLAQITWGRHLLAQTRTMMQYVGVMMARGLITLYVITRLLPAPLATGRGK